MKQQEVLVSIRCLVYNHEPYLRQCLDGFVMQKTNFRFEAIVHDDASTDGTAAIVKEYAEKYPDIIKPIFETENQYSKRDGSIRRIMNNAICQTAKYIAFCEGDDYWTDPLKLQKQFDFMEANPEYGLVYTETIFYNQKKQRYEERFGYPCNSFEDIIKKGNPIPTLTAMIHKGLLFKYLDEISPQTKNWKMGDYPLWLYCSINTKLKFINICSATYRVIQESASHSRDRKKMYEFELSRFNVDIFFLEMYKNDMPEWTKQAANRKRIYFYTNEMRNIAKYGDEKIKKEQYDFLKKNNFKRFLPFIKLYYIFRKNDIITLIIRIIEIITIGRNKRKYENIYFPYTEN